jgi:hypothetical protein
MKKKCWLSQQQCQSTSIIIGEKNQRRHYISGWRFRQAVTMPLMVLMVLVVPWC